MLVPNKFCWITLTRDELKALIEAAPAYRQKQPELETKLSRQLSGVAESVPASMR